MRQKIENRGVTPFAIATTELWGNAHGGVRSGAWWNSLLDVGLELDCQKLGWWENGRFMAQLHWAENRHGQSWFADYSGGFNPVSGVMASDHLRVYNLYYQHDWESKGLSFKIGQLAADDDFMLSDYSSLFLNSAFGAMPSQSATTLGACCERVSPYPIYPVAAPGIFLSWKPTDRFSAQVGVYHGQPGPDATDNYGFKWAESSHPGVALFYEGSYRYNLAGCPATLRVGGTYHSGHFDNFRELNEGSVGAIAHGLYSFYAIHDLTLVRDQQDKPVLGLFCRGGISPQSDRSVASSYFDAGLNWFGPLPGREKDVAGIAVSCTQFGREFRKFSGPDLAANETTLELTYKAQITDYFSLQADLQFLFNPAPSLRTARRETATIIGVRGVMAF